MSALIGTLVGNPRPASRTLNAALALREAVKRVLPGSEDGAVVDAADLAQDLFTPGSTKVKDALASLELANVLVIASPTYKATYTGLLKLFLDQFGAGELGQIPTFPLMLGGSLAHALAPELTLRPVLVEIGASVPAPSLYLLDSNYETSPELDAWLEVARRHVPGAAR